MGILLVVLILAQFSSPACHSASAYQISSHYPEWSYDVISIFNMSANNHLGFDLCDIRVILD